MGAQEPPRKRKRGNEVAEDQDSESDATASNNEVDQSDAESTCVSDEDHYHEDGDCVILVGEVLFKIHRVLLEKDSPNFLKTLRALQQNAPDIWKATEEKIFELDVDVDDFRALCWFIYAPPTIHMQQYNVASADIEKLVSLYLISHEYGFESHKAFAGDLLRKHCAALEARSSAKANYFTKCPKSRLSSLLQIAFSTEQTAEAGSFPFVLQKIWITRLRKKKESLCFPLEVGERLGLRNFVAELYYLELTRMDPTPIRKGSIAYAHPINPDWEPNQQLALYQGYWSLQNYWSKVQDDILLFDCSKRPRHSCRQLWRRSWEHVKSTKSSPRSFDPLQELKDVKAGIIKFADEKDAHVPCALKSIDGMLAELKDSFTDHFLGSLPKLDT